MMSPVFSIIIPCFNCFSMMDRMLQSFEKQSCHDFELIIIDDQSSDNTYVSLQQYIKNSKMNMKLYQNDRNLGPGLTRNYGISYACGEYILFVDSDDYVTDDFIEILSQHSRQKPEIIIFDYIMVYNKYSVPRKSISHAEAGFISPSTAFKFCSGSSWGKVYLRSLIIRYNILFSNNYIGEDFVFTKHALMNSVRILYLNKNLYYYIQHENSLMHNKNSISYRNDLKSFNYIEGIAPDEFKQALEIVFIQSVLYSSVIMRICAGDLKKNTCQYIKDQKKRYANWKNNKDIRSLPLHQQIFLLFLRLHFYPGLMMISFLKKH